MSPRAGLDQEKVLAAAAELVDREGPNGLTVGRLAEVLGVRPPSLYNHMRSVDHVQQELAARGLREMALAIRHAATGLAGFDALSAVARAYRQYALEHPGLYALTLRSRAADPQYAEAAIHATRCLRSAQWICRPASSG